MEKLIKKIADNLQIEYAEQIADGVIGFEMSLKKETKNHEPQNLEIEDILDDLISEVLDNAQIITTDCNAELELDNNTKQDLIKKYEKMMKYEK